MLFFYMGFEHSIVNMFLFPRASCSAASSPSADYMIWNEIPTVIGNLVGRPDLCRPHPLRHPLAAPPLAQEALCRGHRARDQGQPVAAE